MAKSRAQRLRQRERERVKHEAAMAAVRAAGGRCGNCESYERSSANFPKPHCSLKSDWEGYVSVTPDHACPLWRAAP